MTLPEWRLLDPNPLIQLGNRRGLPASDIKLEVTKPQHPPEYSGGLCILATDRRRGNSNVFAPMRAVSITTQSSRRGV